MGLGLECEFVLELFVEGGECGVGLLLLGEFLGQLLEFLEVCVVLVLDLLQFLELEGEEGCLLEFLLEG